MRLILSLVSLILLVATAGCGHASPLEPPWPPERPVYREPPQVDQETVDWIIDAICFFEAWPWYESWDRDVLWGSLEAAFAQSVAAGADGAARKALWYMGVIGMVEFMPTLISALDDYPDTVCSSLWSMPSDYAVYALIPYLNDEDMFLRQAAAVSLGRFRAYSQFPNARWYALRALEDRLSVEPEEWLRPRMVEAIGNILAGMQR